MVVKNNILSLLAKLLYSKKPPRYAPVAIHSSGRQFTPHPKQLYARPAAFYPVNTPGLKQKILFAVLAFVFFSILALMLPSLAFAWGPGVHMLTGNWVLQNLTSLPPDVAAILLSYPEQFLYGSLSPDIFIGKGSVAREGHSHNWDSGFEILGKADNLRRKAYAYGYLSHLAADIVAHNVYVPGTFNTAPGSGRLAHIYIETQADRSIKWDSTDAVGLFHAAGSVASERILRSTLPHTAWKFWFKKHVFEYSIAVGGSKTWRTTMALLDRFFPKKQRLALLDHMLVLSTRAIVNILSHAEDSALLAFDPVGTSALAEAVEKRTGPGIITGGIKNLVLKPLPVLMPGLAIYGTAPKIKLEVPEVLEEFPAVCTPGTFMDSLK